MLTEENEPVLHRSFSQHRLSQVSSSPHSCMKKSLSFLQAAATRHPFLYTLIFLSPMTSSDVNLAQLSSLLLQVTALLFWMQCSIDIALWHSKHFRFVTVNNFERSLVNYCKRPNPSPSPLKNQPLSKPRRRKIHSSSKHPLQQNKLSESYLELQYNFFQLCTFPSYSLLI